MFLEYALQVREEIVQFHGIDAVLLAEGELQVWSRSPCESTMPFELDVTIFKRLRYCKRGLAADPYGLTGWPGCGGKILGNLPKAQPGQRGRESPVGAQD